MYLKRSRIPRSCEKKKEKEKFKFVRFRYEKKKFSHQFRSNFESHRLFFQTSAKIFLFL